MPDDPTSEEDQDERDEPSLLGAIVKSGVWPAVAGVAGADVGAVTNGRLAGVLLAGAATAMIPEVAKALEERQQRAGRSANSVVEQTAELCGISLADLHDWAMRDTATLELFCATVQAALSSLDRQKAAALARVLAEAVEDDAKLDLSTLIVRTVADLETPHVRVLNAMATAPPPLQPDMSPDDGPPPHSWLESSLALRFPSLAHGIEPIIATFRRHGMVSEGIHRSAPSVSHPVWRVTPYGLSVYTYLANSEGPKAADGNDSEPYVA